MSCSCQPYETESQSGWVGRCCVQLISQAFPDLPLNGSAQINRRAAREYAGARHALLAHILTLDLDETPQAAHQLYGARAAGNRIRGAALGGAGHSAGRPGAVGGPPQDGQELAGAADRQRGRHGRADAGAYSEPGRRAVHRAGGWLPPAAEPHAEVLPAKPPSPMRSWGCFASAAHAGRSFMSPDGTSATSS